MLHRVSWRRRRGREVVYLDLGVMRRFQPASFSVSLKYIRLEYDQNPDLEHLVLGYEPQSIPFWQIILSLLPKHKKIGSLVLPSMLKFDLCPAA